MAALRRIAAAGCRVFNSAEVVRWNSDKRYLFDLRAWRVPVVPTYPRSGAGPGFGGSTVPMEPSHGDARHAGEILARLPFDLLYARLDLVRVGGVLSIMELELIEPILNFSLAPGAAGRLAAAAMSRLEGAR